MRLQTRNTAHTLSTCIVGVVVSIQIDRRKMNKLLQRSFYCLFVLLFIAVGCVGTYGRPHHIQYQYSEYQHLFISTEKSDLDDL